ncbi:hypothetical protein HMPREF0972_00049 [Actinomyces sp. oral taxon 848 str. F0332]|nr:hypothetical protein HMPREF0972_00049 [Actinomyces sp. oral taxon 848 str. F0332]
MSTLTRMLKTPVKIITQKCAERAAFLGRHVQKNAESRNPNANLPFGDSCTACSGSVTSAQGASFDSVEACVGR